MDWDVYFIKMARLVASKSKDRSTKIGAVLVGMKHEVLGIGFNGFPRDVDDDVESRHERPEKYLWTEHAERNAIYNAALNGIRLDGATMYCACGVPCADCARAIIQSGIIEVVIDQRTEHKHVTNSRFATQWSRSCTVSNEMLNEAGVIVRRVRTED